MAGHSRRARGFRILEAVIVLAVTGVLVAMAIVELERARLAGNEAAAVGSLRAINSAESTYASSCGAAGYAQSLEDLAKPPPGASQAFIPPDLTKNGIVKKGYAVSVAPDHGATVVTPTMRACNAPAANAMSSYFASANPVSPGFSGKRTFATNKNGKIYARADGEPISSGMYGAVPVQ
jgi:type II secretory pathway pseudopilin PulG